MKICKKSGINLVVLIISIIVMIILSATVIILMNDNDIINNANKSVFISDLNEFKEDLNNSIIDIKMEDRNFDATSINAAWTGVGETNIKTWIPRFSEKYKDKLQIINGELIYIGVDNVEREILQELN